MLKDCLLFKGLSDGQLNNILKRGEIRRYSPGEFIIKEGEEGEEFFVIIEGKVEVSSRESVIAIIDSGGFFGEMALLERTKRSASVRAIEKTEVFVLNRQSFMELLRMNPEAGMQVLRTLSNRLRKSNERVIEEVKRETRLSTLGKVAGTVIHDLKGPISVIKGYLEFLERPEISFEERKDIVNILRGEVDKLMDIIQDFLEFSRGKETLRPMPVKIKDILLPIVESLKPVFSKKGIDVDYKDEDVCCMIDPVKMRRVFYNILMNAIEAMDKGMIVINVASEGDKCKVVFQDNGSGIPLETLNRIFEPFFTSKSGGTGLGLTIVKKVVEDHGGKIEVHSETGKGTEVMLWLPLCS